MYITATDLAHIYGWQIGYVYRLANLHRWGRITVNGRVKYRLADVDLTRGLSQPEVKSA